jgi:20S proteasome alpha/beta subunit
VTLIVGVLTDQYVALMSDRRVTKRVGSRIVSQEDTDTKVVALGGQFLMGFTGLARIGGFRVEV